MNLLQQIETNHQPGPYFQEDEPVPLPATLPVRLIAYYLPQYHPTPENDSWWGRGFTEWTNVTKGLPRYKGHYQPRLPGELGFYDLRQVDVLRRQAELARRYGIEGFCFHHYWFSGKTMLDLPIRNLLAHPEIDLPFCVNWANESWARRWVEGQEHEILIEQVHSEQDDLAFAASLEPLFRDPRYIRVDGRPLLMVYRPKLFPDARATVRRWRAFFREAGLGDPYIVMPLAFDSADPRPYEMDATAGFPPHESGFNAPPIQDSLELFDPAFAGQAIRYADMVNASLAYQPREFRHHPGVCPSWDNDARKPARGFATVGGTPAAYADWLSAACRIALAGNEPDHRIVFINAWNEWGEGAHLEPDRHHGYSYLVETSRALASLGRDATPPPAPAIAAPRRRGFSDWNVLVVRNLAHHAANATGWAEQRLRRLARWQ